VDWLTPSAAIAIKSHKEIIGWVQSAWQTIVGKKRNLAITGMEGVGKTALLHTLTGESLQPGYQKPLRSHKLQERNLKTPEGKIRLSCVPGQKATPRYVALEKLFLSRNPVDGVLHVVANGLATIRLADAAAVLVERGITTLAKYKTSQKKRELEDLQETCKMISQSHQRHRSPTWLIVAVDKIDLYHATIEDARRYYAGQSDFTHILQELTHQLGTNYFRWDAFPISGCREEFRWNDKTLPSELNDDLWKNYLVQFLQELKAR
jgi:hypothetical protein